MADPDVTILLERVGSGDRSASSRLFEAVYDELRRMAASKMKSERDDHTLQPTALVNEAFIRLVGNQDQLTHRAQFFGAAARAMERVLVDHARERGALKRGAGAAKVTFEEVRGAEGADQTGSELDVLEVHEVLDRLETQDPQFARVIRYRFFLGMRLEDIAEVTGVSFSTVRRQWTFARAWLYSQLGPEQETAEKSL